jgi:hypothetical protein
MAIEGIVGASSDLMAIVGTEKHASPIAVDSYDQLERAIVKAAQCGKKVADGYVRFTAPITVHGRVHVKEASAHDSGIVVDDNGFTAFIKSFAKAATEGDGEGMEKLAACDFVNRWIEKVQLDKVDGKEVGLTAPVKVAFADDKAKEWFLSLFKKDATDKAASAKTLVERLVESGVKRAELEERLAAAVQGGDSEEDVT